MQSQNNTSLPNCNGPLRYEKKTPKKHKKKEIWLKTPYFEVILNDAKKPEVAFREEKNKGYIIEISNKV